MTNQILTKLVQAYEGSNIDGLSILYFSLVYKLFISFCLNPLLNFVKVIMRVWLSGWRPPNTCFFFSVFVGIFRIIKQDI